LNPLLSGLSFSLPSGDALGEALEFGAVKHLGIDHANKQRFDGSLAEPLQDALDGASRMLCAR
jgi:hypothetical protein